MTIKVLAVLVNELPVGASSCLFGYRSYDEKGDACYNCIASRRYHHIDSKKQDKYLCTFCPLVLVPLWNGSYQNWDGEFRPGAKSGKEWKEKK